MIMIAATLHGFDGVTSWLHVVFLASSGVTNLEHCFLDQILWYLGLVARN